MPAGKFKYPPQRCSGLWVWQARQDFYFFD
jgi:hypothetical protein